jgi:hypothetical protein
MKQHKLSITPTRGQQESFRCLAKPNPQQKQQVRREM